MSRVFLTALFLFLLVVTFSVRGVAAEPFAEGWTRTYGGLGDDDAGSLIQTGDGGYAIAGGTNSSGAGDMDFWLVKTDSDGNAQWNKTYGTTGEDIVDSVVQTGDGGYAIAGGTYSYGAGGIDVWLVKTDPSGVITEFPSNIVLLVLTVTVMLITVLIKKAAITSKWRTLKLPHSVTMCSSSVKIALALHDYQPSLNVVLTRVSC